MPASRFKSSAMKSQKYNAPTVTIMATAANGISHRRFGADFANFLAVFGFNACPQLAQKAASLAEVALHEAHT
jgi:hypothetical protein